MLIRLLLIAGLWGSLLPSPTLAQTAPGPAHFYVGIGVNQISNVPFLDRGIQSRILGPSFTVGRAFSSRLAVQTGLSYQRKRESYPYRGTTSSGNANLRLAYFIVPVLLRYTITAPAERFRFEVLGGVTAVHATSHLTYESDSPGPIDPVLQPSQLADTRLNLTLGPGVRAAISPRLELTATGLVSANVGDNYGRFQDRLFLNASLGVNYTFGQR
jgi:hypothetical protein